MRSKQLTSCLKSVRFSLLLVLIAAFSVAASAQVPLDPLTLTKYVDPLPIPGTMPQAAPNHYEIGMWEVTQQLHSELPPTTVWGYGVSQATASYPAATIEAVRGVPVTVNWVNNLPMTHLLDYAIDTTLHMAEWTSGVPTVVHLHGGEVEPQSDGGPDAWFTQGFAETGPGWYKTTYEYANDQLPTTLWYHDHVLGITRLNVYAGLAGFYLLRDPAIEDPLNLPSGDYEIEMVIQDRMFNTDGSLHYPVGGDNPAIHPLWQPEFFGNTILVNGKVWPYFEVEPRKYRFRILNGSNSRFYAMEIWEDVADTTGPGFWQIGSDGGYLDAPVLISDPNDPNSPRLVIAPGERRDVIVDFSGYTPGTTFTVRNNARSPYPNGMTVNPMTDGQIMQFRVVELTAPDNSSIATPGPGYVEKLTTWDNTRQLTLDEIMGPNGPIRAILNNTTWDAPTTETPELGSTEVWKIINTTGDAHPIHLHLVQFQLVSRQKFQANKYAKVYQSGQDAPAPDITPYLIGQPMPPGPGEDGWKDTYIMFPGEVTTVIARFAPQDGDPNFTFDATAEPGYVWHCHILEHEDNEMMRRLKIMPAPAFAAAKSDVGGNQAPASFGLEQNYPNPFNPSTEISFSLSEQSHVKLEVFNLLGQRVSTLADEEYPAGRHTVNWDASKQASGVYFYRISTKDGVDARRMMLLK
jgi:FtsP/CotA-like multicopper oxidase with cupredoxin domain